jgi:homoserine kinase
MVGSEASAFAPATLSNLGTGFDVLGLALSQPGDTVRVRLVSEPGVRVVRIDGDGGKLSMEATRNTAGIAAAATLVRAGLSVGVELELIKGLPIGSGLGSSASSAVAAAFAVNLALGSPLRRADLVGPCLAAEEAVSGRHADNVAPALLGGLVLVRSLDPIDLVRLPLPEGLEFALVTPDMELLTRTARAVLPKDVPLSVMTRNSANLAAIVSACHSGDLALLARAIPDEVVTPARTPLIPGCAEVIDAALDAGALAASISGAGPTLFALCRSPRTAQAAVDAMVETFGRHGLAATGFVSAADNPGVRAV